MIWSDNFLVALQRSLVHLLGLGQLTLVVGYRQSQQPRLILLVTPLSIECFAPAEEQQYVDFNVMHSVKVEVHNKQIQEQFIFSTLQLWFRLCH